MPTEAETLSQPCASSDEEESRALELTVGPIELRRDFEGIVGQSTALRNALALLPRIASAEVSVLLTGETGTGKEVFARAIYAASGRKDGPFVVVNCSAVPASLFEAELFGHKRGAFTGATRDHVGYAQQADRGVLFLDEVGDLPLELQPKLLRLIQEHQFRPVGGEADVRADIRFIAATHRDLEQDVAAGRFRADLYYRLNVVQMLLPPLRDRASDVPALVRHFLAVFGRAEQRVTTRAMRALCAYAWPGNVRELENELQRAMVLAGTGAIESRHLSARVRSTVSDSVKLPMRGTLVERLAALEREVVAAALVDARGNRTRAAQALGVTRQGLRIKLRRLGLEGKQR